MIYINGGQHSELSVDSKVLNSILKYKLNITITLGCGLHKYKIKMIFRRTALRGLVEADLGQGVTIKRDLYFFLILCRALRLSLSSSLLALPELSDLRDNLLKVFICTDRFYVILWLVIIII